MTWIIDNIWAITGALSAFITNVITIAVGWTKLNGRVRENAKGIKSTNEKIDELKEEVRNDQKQITEEVRGMKDTQVKMLQELSALNAKIGILIEKK